MDLRSVERHRVAVLRRGRGQVEQLRRRLALRQPEVRVQADRDGAVCRAS